MNNLGFDVYLTKKMHKCAQNLAAQQTHESKAKQVYLNSLAICAVRFYFEILQIETDWKNSDSFDAIMQTFFNLADLKLTGIGKLECRPVLAEQQNTYIPIECEDRIGYVFVRLDASLKNATILGFLRTVPIDKEFSLNRLDTLKQLLKYLKEVKDKNQLKFLNEPTTHLSRWLIKQSEDSWQSTSNLLKMLKNDPELCWRNYQIGEICRGKIFNFDTQMLEHRIVLLVTIEPVNTANKVDVLVQALPEPGRKLPKGLELSIIDDTEDIFLLAVAKKADDLIQQGFFANYEERFKIELALGNAKITENFLI